MDILAIIVIVSLIIVVILIAAMALRNRKNISDLMKYRDLSGGNKPAAELSADVMGGEKSIGAGEKYSDEEENYSDEEENYSDEEEILGSGEKYLSEGRYLRGDMKYSSACENYSDEEENIGADEKYSDEEENIGADEKYSDEEEILDGDENYSGADEEYSDDDSSSSEFVEDLDDEMLIDKPVDTVVTTGGTHVDHKPAKLTKNTRPKTIKFKDHPEFRPNLTPRQIFLLGSFGGTYWRPIYSRVTKKKYKNKHKRYPKSWWKGIPDEHLTSQVCRPEINRYGVVSGTSLREWESKKWIKAQDPYGWVQWYCEFYSGRRSEDDERQISRWMKFAGENGRFRKRLVNMLKKSKKKYDDPSVSPVIRQGLQQWAYKITSRDLK